MNPSRLWLATVVLALSTTAGAVPSKLPLHAGEVRDIVNQTGSATILYAATQGGGVYKSTNAGANWAVTGLNTGYVWKIAISDIAPTTTLYAATEAGLFKSVDSGTSWTQLTFDPARTVAVDPNSVGSDRILLGVTGVGILRSTNGGTNWERQSTGLDSLDPTHIVIRSSPASEAFVVLNCNSEDARFPYKEGNWGGVFRTANLTLGTITWTNYNAPGGGAALPSKCVRGLAATATGTRLIAGIRDPFDGTGGIYKTDGAGWTFVQDLFGVETIVGSAASATTFHAGTRGVGVQFSTNSGDSWAARTDAAGTHSMLRRTYAIGTTTDANTVIASAKGLGLMRSANYLAGGVVWSEVAGLNAGRARALANSAALPATMYAGLDGGGIVRSVNSGGAWSRLFTGLDLGFHTLDILPTVSALAADPANPNVVLAGARPYGLFQLSGGTTWTQAGLPTFTTTQTFGAEDFKPQHLLIPSANAVFYTLFDGASAKAGGLVRSLAGAANLVQTQFPHDILSCAPLTTAMAGATKVVAMPNGVVYLLRHDSSMPYRSAADAFGNAGTAACVTVTHSGYERVTFHDMAQRSGSNTVVGATSKGIFRSTDNGQSFDRVTVSGLTSQVLSALAYNGTTLYGADRGGRLYCSTNDGTSWQNVNHGLAQVPFRDMKLMNGSLHIVTDGAGIYNGFAATCP
jgi:hypothetical protein